MKIIIFIFLSLIFFSSCIEEEEFPFENDIMVLTNSTFDKAINKFDYILVMFYAPWCGHCKKFKPELEKASAVLKKENLFIAKVDATEYKDLAQKYNVKGYPTVKFFIKGLPIDYDGSRHEQEVIEWVRKKSIPPTKNLASIEDVEKFQKDNEVCIIYFGKNKEDLKIFTNIAIKNDDLPFGIVDNEKISKKFNAKPNSVVIFKKFDEKRNDLEKINEKELNEFVLRYSQKRVGTFDSKTIQFVFGKNHPAIVYFGEKGEKWDNAAKILEIIAIEIGEKLRVVMSEVKDGIGKRLSEYIGIKNKDLPTLALIDTRKYMKKYLLKGEIEEKNILNLIEGWEKGLLKPYLKTQEEPKENNEDVFVIVGKSFQKEVIENDKDVMLVFYAPWCGNSQKLLPKYEEAAKKLKLNNPKIVLAKMDATENEIESVHISGFPVIKFYPGNKKDKDPIDYKGEKETDAILKFIQANAYNKVVLDEEKTGDL